MKLLLDEMHSPLVAAKLRALGHDVVAVKERPELMGLDDPSLLVSAKAESRVLVTENVKDFAAIHWAMAATGGDHAGLVFTHPRRFPRHARNHVNALAAALAEFLDVTADALGITGSFVWWLET